LVLGCLAVAMALAYTIVRSQTTELQIASNSRRQGDARSAARAGLAIALGKMHLNSWSGADTSLSGNLSDTDRYVVSYTTGDDSLTSASPDYSDWPLRVTVVSTGYSQDPSSGSTATHQVKAVVRLVPRALPAEPAGWSSTDGFSVYQRLVNGGVIVNVPFRVEGAVRFQSVMQLALNYSWPSDARERFMEDINLMRGAGYGDHRPFVGPIHYAENTQTSDTRHDLEDLAVPIVNVPNASLTDWTTTAPITSYQLYPGGRSYSIPVIGTGLQDVSYAPDPLTNPLGIWYRNSEVSLLNNVTIKGMIVADTIAGDLYIQGTNVNLLPVELPALEGDPRPIRLPTAIVGDDFRVWNTGGGTLTGLIDVKDEFEYRRGLQTVTFGVTGRVVTKSFFITARDDWAAVVWTGVWAAFESLLDTLTSGGENTPEPYFPVWLKQTYGLDYQPRLTVKPDPTPYRYHWLSRNAPLYAAHPSDPGLRWEIVDWQDGG
jgi:hypothetical protein